MNKIQRIAKASVRVKQSLLEDVKLVETIAVVSQKIEACFKNDGKVLFCGNGGSAADAQHIAAELSGRFYTDREPLFAEALHVNSSYITAVANDYDFDTVYNRMVKAMGRSGDVLVGISTSGKSPNILNALKVANEQGMITVGLTGNGDHNMSVDHLIAVPSDDTPRIQECHIMVGHMLCELVENAMFGD